MHILGQFRRHLAVTQRTVVLFRNPHPRPDMHFVNRHRRLDRITRPALLHPFLVAPGVIEIPHHRCRSWRLLLQQSNRIGLIDAVPVMMRLDMKLVERALVCPGNESFPDARIPSRAQGMRLRMPLVEASNHRHRTRIRRPHGETRSRFATRRHEVRAHLFVNPVVATLIKQIEVVVGQQGNILPRRARRTFRRLAHIPLRIAERPAHSPAGLHRP